ncbi:hypothetical protein [Streptomyces sp. H39-S7]|uniref:hypothetical protein n=1 Tax=Streptomyces sp. H39-S7 TaxID=3004357 RepID=UPI0022AFEAD0|nr:hypothetical protein [Streptomyces sp. H39-S7]MCZ4119966.1 hypothetical protein [Streptomyces sp. H39-S7]
MSADPPPMGDLLRLYAIAPHLGADELRRGVCRVLTGDDPRPGPWPWPEGRHGQVLRHAGVTAEVAGSWDGPQLWLRVAHDSQHASRAAELLADIAASAGETARHPRPRPAARHDRRDGNDAPGNRSTPGYRAWRAMMRRWDVPGTGRAEIAVPGRLDPVDPTDHDIPSEAPQGVDGVAPLTFVFDHTPARQPPPGWLLRSWFFPAAGRFHCSWEASGRLRVRTPRTADRPQAVALLSVWRAVTAELDVRPDLPPDALNIPPRAFVLAARDVSPSA